MASSVVCNLLPIYNAVFGMCKYFSELDPILHNCPSKKPLKATLVAEEKIRSSKKKRDDRKSLVPSKKRDKKDDGGAALMNLTKAMVNKYKCQEKKLEMEEKHLSL